MRKVLFFLVTSLFMNAQQSGALDLGFTASVNNGFDNQMNDVVALNNGKILVSGSHDYYNGTISRKITRLNNNGSIDQTFNTGGSGVYNGNYVKKIHVLPNGKILAGGFFSDYNGVAAGNFMRLNEDGTLDPTFMYTNSSNIAPNSIAVQQDGKIIIGGNSSMTPRIMRVNADGTADPLFNPGIGTNGSIWQVAVQNDGKILIAGQFSSYNGSPAISLARLNSDGSVDPSFNMGSGLYYQTWNLPYINALVLQSDGKILVGGTFISYNGVAATGFLRLNVDGSMDPTFNMGTGFSNGTMTPSVGAVRILPDGKLLVSGGFYSYNGVNSKNVIKLNSDGTVDSSINFGTGLQYSAQKVDIQPDGKIIIISDSNIYNGIPIKGKIIRLQNSFLGTQEATVSSLDVSLYPNPTHDEVQIKTKEKLISYEVYSMTGQLVSSGDLKQDDRHIPMRELVNGIYTVKILTEKGVFSRNVIKK